jgi:hypothetical protein
MKKFVRNAVVSAVGTLIAGLAAAGAITAPATDNAATPYAVEGLVNTTDITGPQIVYTMGVARTTAQDFTIIMTPSAGATFTAGTCAASRPIIAGAGVAVATIKRASTTECAYEVDVTTDTTTATTLTFASPVFDTHTLATSGNSVSVSLNLWDLGETARIDNNAAVTRRVAISGNALTLAAASDTATKADVNDEQGPLFGFVTGGDDADAVARAAFSIGNNSAATRFKLPDGVTDWDFVVNGTNIAVSVAGNFQGLAANGFTATTGIGVAPTVTASAASSVATFTLAPGNIGGVGTDTTVTTTFTSARTASLGTSRVFGVSAVGDVATGADVTLVGSNNWWSWGANASQLVTPYFTTNSLFLSRYFFLNTGTGSVTYSADCFSETGSAITYGSKRTGTLSAATAGVGGMTAINAADVCTFASSTRGSVVFTVNAPINTIKGTYQSVDPVSLNNTVVPMVRPYNVANTTE